MSARRAKRPDLAEPLPVRGLRKPRAGDRVYRTGTTAASKRAQGTATVIGLSPDETRVWIRPDDDTHVDGWTKWPVNQTHLATHQGDAS